MTNNNAMELDTAALDSVHGGGLVDGLLNLLNHLLGTEGNSPARVTREGVSVSPDNVGKPPEGAQ